ncbi:response regulator [Thiorhodospira sibirica]|uniref:response regulator n=1 Tax=Thiorhodospira sibirica TaxID=154347 RepID=UPI00022C52C9|nr:response regulator [Thiorhodospira sibirica]
MSHSQSILIVDDQLDNLKLLSDVLRPLYRVQAVTRGAQALGLLAQGAPPDLLLLDIMMPEMDGYTLCQRIKACSATADIPIIFLTAKTDSDSEIRGFAVGAVDYVTKPIHPPALLARVAAHLALAAQRKKLSAERDEIQRLVQKLTHEIAERERAEAQLRILAKAVEQAPASIVITDRDGTITYVNPYFSQITGYTQEEAIGQNPRVLKSDQQEKALYQHLWETITQGQIWRGELINQNKAGSLFYESVAISPILDDQGQITHYVAVKEDIGDRKELERIKEDVEHIMRHDLKSLLNPVIGFPDLLLLDDNLSTEQREALTLIRESGQKMHNMINLSLDLFKMETGQYHYEAQTVNLIVILHELQGIAATQMQSKNLQLQMCLNGEVLAPETMLLVRADARLLFSLLANLLTNAVEASPHGANIVIELTTPGPVVLALRNQGTVPERIRQHFFAKYCTYGKRSGTGLGTYSAKLLADTMGMDLRMETSDTENNTCIYLTLSVAQ